MKIVEVKVLPDFCLHLRFDNGTCGQVNLSSLTGQGVFSAWLQPGFFSQVHISSEGGLEWPGELDLCPDALYLQMTGKTPGDLFPSLSSLAHA